MMSKSRENEGGVKNLISEGAGEGSSASRDPGAQSTVTMKAFSNK